MNTKIREMKRSNLVIAVVAVALLAVSCGIGISVYAQTASAPPDENGDSTVNTQEQEPAPQTNDQTDDDAQLAESLKNALSTSSEGLTEVTHPDGTVTVDLEGRFQNFSVAKINPDGTLTTACVSDAKDVDEFFGTKDKATVNNRVVKSSRSTRKAGGKN